MPGTRTAPAITGTPTFKEVSLRWIDANGNRRSDASIVDAAATDIQVEAVAADMQAASNASLWAVRLVEIFEGAMTKTNALSAVKESENDNIVYHSKDATRADRRAFLPAPLESVFVSGTNVPDPANALLAAVMLAWEDVWAGTFSGLSLRFSERREINEKVNL